MYAVTLSLQGAAAPEPSALEKHSNVIQSPCRPIIKSNTTSPLTLNKTVVM